MKELAQKNVEMHKIKSELQDKVQYKNKVFELEQKICDLTKELENLQNENEDKSQDLIFALVLIFALTFLGTKAQRHKGTKARRHKVFCFAQSSQGSKDARK